MFQCILSPKPHYLDFKKKSRWIFFIIIITFRGGRREFVPRYSWGSEALQES